ncbi:hypothetical protein HELRODRAFT_170454 [Helobdella robusta]|uniref:Uncharacterized protein n=1 Tax=Helobdella robusta TaxID=6412 RepID=T1F330_HELRO|nr:hypothetical protein HELRODRAFT_170454 [Helobdella robusta]ESO07149.1 hypothetical protein HELRODRAFT_170454 [Helobdella robusta]
MLDGVFDRNFKDQRLAKVEELTEARKEKMVKKVKQSHRDLDDMVKKMEELTKKLQMIIEAQADEINYKLKNSKYSDDDFEVLPLDADDVENEVPNFMAPVSDNAAFGARKKNFTDTKASCADVEEESFEIISRSEVEKDCPEIEELTMEAIKKELADIPQAEIGKKMKTRAKHVKKQTLDTKFIEERLRTLEKQLEENEKKIAKKSVRKEKSRKKHDSSSDSFEFIRDDEIEEAKAKH